MYGHGCLLLVVVLHVAVSHGRDCVHGGDCVRVLLQVVQPVGVPCGHQVPLRVQPAGLLLPLLLLPAPPLVTLSVGWWMKAAEHTVGSARSHAILCSVFALSDVGRGSFSQSVSASAVGGGALAGLLASAVKAVLDLLAERSEASHWLYFAALLHVRKVNGAGAKDRLVTCVGMLMSSRALQLQE